MTASFTPARRVEAIRESPSSAAADKVRALKASGVQVVNLTVGEPDYDTPETIKQVAKDAIDAGETKYTPVNGTPALRAAIKQRMKRVTGLEYADDQICVGGGGKQVIYMTFAATLNPGDEVIIPSPYWVSYPDMVVANDGTPVIVNTYESSGYKLEPKVLRRYITPQTRWLVLNTPGNPSGAVYSRQEIDQLAEVLRDFPDVWVLADEIYDEITYLDEPMVRISEGMESIRDRVFSVNGVSKAYAMTGWRLGYGVGDPRLVAAINKLQSQSSSCPSSISQVAAAEALTGDQSFVEKSVVRYQERRDRAVELFGAIEGLKPIVPHGAFYLFVDCAGLIGKKTPKGKTLSTDQDVVLYFLDSARVAVIQGSAYGSESLFRISFATDLDTIAAGAEAIDKAVHALTA